MYDIASKKETRITTDKADQTQPAIWGNIIVWKDTRNGNDDIYMYDINTGKESPVVTDPAEQSNPAIEGNYIVWEDQA